MSLTRNEALDFLLNRPYEFGRMIGFTKLQPIHNEWIVDMVRGQEDVTLQAHRGSYKTTCVSIALSLIIILLPNKKTVFIRKTGDDVVEIIKQVQKILQSPYTRYLVYAIYGVDLYMTELSQGHISTNLAIDNKGTSQLVGIGTQGSITGKHFDRIFTDDIVNVNDRISRAERNRTKLFYQELQNIKNVGGRIYNTGTPWHKDDCFTIMPNPRKYDCYTTGLLTADDIADLRSKMTPSLFSANYELKHIADDQVIFTSPHTDADSSLAEQGIVHIDAAYGGEDYTAFTVCKKTAGKYYVFGKLWRKHVDDCVDEMIALRQRFNAGRIYNEDNADKGYLAKILRARGEATQLYHESMNKFMKIVTYLKSEWDNVYFVRGTDSEYIDQICDYFEQAEHDDAPDSLASVVRILWKKTEQQENYKPIFG